MNIKFKTGLVILPLLLVVAITVLLLSPSIIQNPDYHYFSDNKTLFGIPNFLNVISNLPFLFVGIYGLIKTFHNCNNQIQLTFVFSGITMVALGSGYYHLHPSNNSLLWDRLPMTLVFMALFSLLISEYLNKTVGLLLLLPMLLVGILSIIYWRLTGNLKPYVLVQFYPMLSFPIVLLLFNNGQANTKAYWLLLSAYVLAKCFETFDYQLHSALLVISGHSLKHVVAALGIWVWAFKYSYVNPLSA